MNNMIRRGIFLIFDALTGSLVAAFLIVAMETIRNGHLAAGLIHLPLFAVAEKFQMLFIPALWICAFVAGTLWLVTWLGSFGRTLQFATLGIAGVVAALLIVYQNKIIDHLWSVVGYGVPQLMVSQSVQFITEDTTTWTVIFAISVILSVARKRRPDLHSTLGGVRIPFAIVLIAGLLIGAAWTDRIALNQMDPGRKNILLVVLDTVAANHMASYGYHRVTTPEIDRLAERGIHFTYSYSVSSWTLPSHASMFTGFYPIQHGATQENLELHYRFHTLAEILRNDGYRTFAAVNNPVLGISSKLHQGFAEYLPMWRRIIQVGFEQDGQHSTNIAVKKFLDGLNGHDRFFIFLNYMEAHSPYLPPSEFRARFLPEGLSEARVLEIDQSWQKYYTGRNLLSKDEFQILNDLYDGELLFLSKTVDDLIKILEERELLQNTLVIITSDHGENIGDHGHLDHVFTLYNNVLRIPLIILDSGMIGGTKDASLATSVDIFKTVLGAARARYDVSQIHGRDLLNTHSSKDVPDQHLAEYYYPNQVLSVISPDLLKVGGARLRPYLRRIRSLQTPEWKLIWGSDGKHELYNLKRDPGEETNVATNEPERVKLLTEALEKRLQDLKGGDFSLDKEMIRKDTGGFKGMDRETLEQLRSLGYVQ